MNTEKKSCDARKSVLVEVSFNPPFFSLALSIPKSRHFNFLPFCLKFARICMRINNLICPYFDSVSCPWQSTFITSRSIEKHCKEKKTGPSGNTIAQEKQSVYASLLLPPGLSAEPPAVTVMCAGVVLARAVRVNYTRCSPVRKYSSTFYNR